MLDLSPPKMPFAFAAGRGGRGMQSGHEPAGSPSHPVGEFGAVTPRPGGDGAGILRGAAARVARDGPRGGPRRALLPGLALALTVALFGPFTRLYVDELHDGYVLKPALDVLSGQTLYRDTFSTYGPLTTYLHVLWLKAFGANLLAIRVGTLLAYGVAAAFLVSAWREVMSTGPAVVAYLVWLGAAYVFDPGRGSVFFPWSSVYALAFQAMALDFLLKSLRARRPLPLAALCGTSAALAFWCRFTVGVFLTAAVVAAYAVAWRVRGEPVRGRLAAFAAAGAAIHAAFLAHVWASGAFHDWVYQNFTWNSQVFVRGPLGSRLESVLSSLLLAFYLPTPGRVSILVAAGALALLAAIVAAALPGDPDAASARAGGATGAPAWLGLAALAVAVFAFRGPLSHQLVWAVAVPYAVAATTLAISARWLFRPVSRAGAAGAWLPGCACGLVALASWTQYFPVPTPDHMFWALAPGCGAFVFALRTLARGRALAVVLGVVIVLAPRLIREAGSAWETWALPYARVGGSPVLCGMLVPQEDASQWAAVLGALGDYTAAHPDATLVIYGEKAIYAALVPDLRNAAPFFVYLEHCPVPADLFARRRAFIRDRKPLLLFEEYTLPGIRDTVPEAPNDPKLYANQRAAVLAEFRYVTLVGFTRSHPRPARCTLMRPAF
jgi:hypothetical protein